jgi:hypothetical protein
MDFKTSQPSPAHIGFYGRQLHAYAYALEHPAPKALGLHPVKRLGLLYLDPVDIDHLPDQRRITYGGEVTWTEIPLEMERFMDFMSGVLTVLAQPEPPPPSEGCAFCAYREEARLQIVNNEGGFHPLPKLLIAFLKRPPVSWLLVTQASTMTTSRLRAGTILHHPDHQNPRSQHNPQSGRRNQDKPLKGKWLTLLKVITQKEATKF